MRDAIGEINQIIKKEEEDNKLIHIPDYDEYKALLNEVGESIWCPILCMRFKKPKLAPSGMVYDSVSVDKIVNRDNKDPFTRLRFCENIKRGHYFYKEIIDLIKRHADMKKIDIYKL